MSQFLDADGYINVAEFISLARDIDKLAVQEGLKPKEIYFSKKAIVKADHPSKAKIDETAFAKKRAQPIKSRARMPASGSRVRMMVWLRNYKGLDQFGDYWSDFQNAVKAIERHTAKAEKTLERIKVAYVKTRDSANAAFDKNLDCFINKVLPEDVDYAVGKSMMGKTLIVALPNGGFVSIGKSDKEKFLKARESENAPVEKAPRKLKPVVRAATKPAARATAKPTRAAKPLMKPVRSSRTAR